MSGSMKKIISPITEAGGLLAAKVDTSPYEDMISYYANYDTSLSDNTLKNLGTAAQDLSANLTDYITSVNGSDAAREEAQNAIFNSYQSLLEPTHQTQMNDLNSKLLNQGLTVGSEAYQRAINDLTQQQNLAMNQAAYKAVTEGNNAFNQTFNQALENAKLNNEARENQLTESYKYIDHAPTSLGIREKMYGYQESLSQANAMNEQAEIQALLALIGMFA